MDLPSNFKMMAAYNQRVNQQLLDVCASLSSQKLLQEHGSFFPSIMAHWNHILFGDLIMLQRLVENGLVTIDAKLLASLPRSTRVNDTFVSSYEELVELRNKVDNIYLDITAMWTVDDMWKAVQYTTTEGQKIERTLGEFVQHIFNHQTHHRGQMTCLLSQLNLDYGCMDLPVVVPEGMNL
tara:strand:- start:312 stop:854 length:543 start_codon:yes stop_codon:yes gene_type:complete